MRIASIVLLLVGVAPAQTDYDSLLTEAARVRLEQRPGEPEDRPIQRAYELLARAVQLEPDRWEAYELRGVNRCELARTADRILEQHVTDMRARYEDPAAVANTERQGRAAIQAMIQTAYDEFRKAEFRMKKAGRLDPNHITFANAAMKYAGKEFLEAKHGAPGAIADFETLVRAGWGVEYCREFVARSYNELARVAYIASEFEKAQAYWDEALKWVERPATREMIYTNKAGAFQMDNEFAPAEEVLRAQIERQPHVAAHWKNLGLILGYQNRLREALHCYEKARELCARAPILPLLHGNAWLKAAMIHGKLLEHDGDLMLAWRLFAEYRGRFGDDYNFAVNFGQFCSAMGRYDLAWRYLTYARDMRPFCPGTYQLLLEVAPRTGGTPDEVAQRVQEAKDAWQEAQSRYSRREETPALQRLCGGLRDLGDEGPTRQRAALLEPDPLPGFDVDHPPPWIVEAAARRDPFVPWSAPGAEPSPGDAKGDAGGSAPPRRWPWLAGAAAIAAVLAAAALVRRRAAA